MKFLILGAGPTGLGAAWRLHELGLDSWRILEACDYPGGLATSFQDAQGFTWDVGAHVQYSHYEYFDRVMDALLAPEDWLWHRRESWVWLRERFVPYPFQHNMHRLPPAELEACVQGLVQIHESPPPKPADFREWILATFGRGIADIFMLPYNLKVWAHPPEMLNAAWVGERVAMPDLKRVLHSMQHGKDDVSWGPNRMFHFPRRGGTGAIWKECAQRLPAGNFQWHTKVVKIDLPAKTVHCESGETHSYDALISTMPLTELIRISGAAELSEAAAAGLLHSSSNIIGIGLEGKPADHLRTKCWMYYPEGNCPFYRVTVFSNYSPNNVPDSSTQWSLMAEVSESRFKPVARETLIAEVIAGLRAVKLIEPEDKVVSTWSHRAPYGYPIPGINRDEALARIIPHFEQHQVFSRGRFGGWKYEVSNQDHSFMQGVEVAERLVAGHPEITFPDPAHANSKKHPFPYERWSGGAG
jgi:protoporphyrinogen oxidase